MVQGFFKLSFLIILKRIESERLYLPSHYLGVRFLSVLQAKQNQICSLISWDLAKKGCLGSKQVMQLIADTFMLSQFSHFSEGF